MSVPELNDPTIPPAATRIQKNKKTMYDIGFITLQNLCLKKKFKFSNFFDFFIKKEISHIYAKNK